MTDSSITDRQTITTKDGSVTLTEFDSERYLLTFVLKGGQFQAHLNAEEFDEFQAMVSIVGAPRRRPFDQAEFDAFRADPKKQALVSRILAVLDVDEDKFGVPTVGWCHICGHDIARIGDHAPGCMASDRGPEHPEIAPTGPNLPPWADR